MDILGGENQIFDNVARQNEHNFGVKDFLSDFKTL